jgi:peptidoglycan hydrolase-like protein with peptidoglycan-binding domain
MAKKQDNMMLWIAVGVGAFFLLKPKVASSMPVATTVQPRLTTTNRATTGSITLSGSSYVKWYQAALNDLVGANLELDGIVGPLTQAAIVKFQTMRQIPQTGIVDPQTDYEINSALGMSGYVDYPYAGEGNGVFVY